MKNKIFIVMVALSSMFSLVAMEKEQEYRLKAITKEESKNFVVWAKSALDYSNKAVDEDQITHKNALHFITYRYNQYLILANNNLSEMIQQQGLQDRLEGFKKIEFDEEIVKIKDSIFDGIRFEGDKAANALFKKDGSYTIVERNNGLEFKQLRTELANRRKLLAALNLELRQPTYSRPLEKDDRISSMVKNKDYPLDEGAIKDYIATLIYRHVLAPRIIIYVPQSKIECC